MGAKVALVSLGCCKNLVDSEFILGDLKDQGFELVPNPALAEVIIVNTCGFIEEAKREAVETLLAMAEMKVKGKAKVLIAAGCLAQRYPRELRDEMPELDAVVGVGAKRKLPEVVKRCLKGERVVLVPDWPRAYREEGRRVLSTLGFAYLKIAEGCNNRCTYCSIPYIRGPLVSRNPKEIVDEAKFLVKEHGIKELILAAQDTTAYGQDLTGQSLLPQLLEQLSQIEGLVWIRLMYAHPGKIDDRVVESLCLPKVVPYLDMPVQHGSDRILKAMGRGYSAQKVKDLVGELRLSIPGLALRTTLMTGFPGEKDKDHLANIELLQELRFDWAGVFAYSHEENTSAGYWEDDVPEEVKNSRKEELLLLQQGITAEKNRQRVGQEEWVIIDGKMKGGYFRGRAYFQAPEVDGAVLIKSDLLLKPGDMVKAKFKTSGIYDLKAELS